MVYVALIGSSLIRRRWRRLVKLAVLSSLATGGLAAFWLWSDGRIKPAIEHYTLVRLARGDQPRPLSRGSPGDGRVGRAGSVAIRPEAMEETTGRWDEISLMRSKASS